MLFTVPPFREGLSNYILNVILIDAGSDLGFAAIAASNKLVSIWIACMFIESPSYYNSIIDCVGK